MIHKRDNGFVRIILEPAKGRIERSECPSCGLPKSEWKRRKDWLCCSSDCTSKFEQFCIVRDWATMRDKIFRRDKFTCAMCGKKSYEVDHVYAGERGDEQIKMMLERNPNERYEIKPSKNEWFDRVMVWLDRTSGSGLVADHIKPIAIGGPQWDMENIQTLCVECNKVKTKSDQGLIAVQRRVDKVLDGVQKELAM